MSDDEYEYLNDGFNGRQLLKDQLRNILLTHNVEYSDDMRKPQLFELFQKEIVPRRAELRQKFVYAAASNNNISNASPPNLRPELAPRSRNRSPSPPRSRSPHRAKSPRRVTSRTEQAVPERDLSPSRARRLARTAQKEAQPMADDAVTEPVVEKLSKTTKESKSAKESKPKLKDVPDLNFGTHASKSASPRRVRVRKGEESADGDVKVPANVLTGDIKLRATRSPQRKRNADELTEADESFTHNNVFQSSSAKRAKIEKRPVTPTSPVQRSHSSANAPTSASSTNNSAKSASKSAAKPLPEPETISSAESGNADVAMTDIGFDVPLDADMVANLNANMANTDELNNTDGMATTEDMDVDNGIPEAEVNAVVDQLFAHGPPESHDLSALERVIAGAEDLPPFTEIVEDFAGDFVQSAEPESSAEPEFYAEPGPAQPEPEKPREVSARSESTEPIKSTPAKTEELSKITHRRPTTHEDVGYATRPSAASVARSHEQDWSRRVSAAPGSKRRGFIPSLAELNVSPEFAQQLENHTTPSPVPSRRESTTNQSFAAHSNCSSVAPSQSPEPSVLMDAEEMAARDIHNVLGNLPEKLANIEMPHLPNVHLPNVHLPNVHLPEVRLPEVHFPSVDLRNKLPRIPRRNWPSLADILTSIFKVSAIGLAVGAGLLLVGFVAWYRDAYGSVQYCSVGAPSPHNYPTWTTFNTGNPLISEAQAQTRKTMNQIWPDCWECPEHAHCYEDQGLLCDPGYSAQERWLTKLNILKLPPKCITDWESQRKHAVLSERLADYLRDRRAEVMCTGDMPCDEADITSQAAISASELKQRLKAEKSDLLSEAEFDSLWEKVVEILPKKYTDVYVVSDHILSYRSLRTSEDYKTALTPTQITSNNRSPGADFTTASESFDGEGFPETEQEEILNDLFFVSVSDSRITMSCRLRRSLIRWVHRHRQMLTASGLGVLGLGCFFLLVRSWLSRRQNRQKLVKKFLDQLKAQRELSAKNPDTPAYLRTIELRRQVPRSEWPHIQEAVEANEFVRMRQIEVYGEIMRIWEWIS